MTQLLGIIRYELLMSWRRRSLPVLIAFFLLALLFISYLVADLNTPISGQIVELRVENGTMITVTREDDGTQTENILDQQTANQVPEWLIGLNMVKAGNTLLGIYVILPSLMVIVVGIVPLLSDTIPLDRQYRMRELLDSKPISRATYLGGKLLSLWIGLTIGVFFCVVVIQIILYLLYGEYDLSAHGLLWLIAVLPLVLLVTAITVLSTSRAGSRRTAILFSLLLIPVAVYLYFNAVMTLGNVGRIVHPFYGLGLMDVYLAGDDFRPALAGDIAGMLLLFVLIFGAVWGVAWANARLTEAR